MTACGKRAGLFSMFPVLAYYTWHITRVSFVAKDSAILPVISSQFCRFLATSPKWWNSDSSFRFRKSFELLFFFFLTACLKCDLHIIKFSHFKCTALWVIDIFAMLQMNTTTYFFNISVTHKDSLGPVHVGSYLHTQPSATTTLDFVSRVLHF